MTSLRLRLLSSVAPLLLAAAFPAHAQINVQGTSWGTFSNLSSCDSSGSDRDCRIVSTTANGSNTQVQWGSTSSHTDFRDPSTLTARDLTISAVTNATSVTLGRLDWYNSATRRFDSSLDVFSVRWTLGLNFTAPSGSDVTGSEQFALSIRNPINPTGDSVYGLSFTDLTNLGSSFSLNGVTVSNLRYQVVDGSGPGTSTFTNNVWYNPEYNNASLMVVADLSSVATPVPEPETYAMLLAGLGFLGFATRRRRAQKAPALSPA